MKRGFKGVSILTDFSRKKSKVFLIKIFYFFCSLKVAVMILLCLAICLASATFLESAYDGKTAQRLVYRSWFFISLLGILGLEILLVAFSRWPWKKRHIPF